MKKAILLFLACLPLSGMCQIKTAYVLLELKIVDSETKSPVKYTRIYDKDNAENINTTNTDALTFDDENFGKVSHMLIECNGYETVMVDFDFSNFKYNVKVKGYDQESVTIELPSKNPGKDLSFLSKEPLIKFSFQKAGKNRLTVISDQDYASMIQNKIKQAPLKSIPNVLQGKFLFSGKVNDQMYDTLALKNVKIELFRNDTLVETVYTIATGKYMLQPVAFNANYKIRYSLPGMVSKFITIDGKIPEENSFGDRPLNLNARLFSSAKTCDYSFLETTPVLKAYYEKSTDEITFDTAHIEQVKNKITEIQKSCK